MDGILITSDGREICRTPEAWNERRGEVWRRAGRRCEICRRYVSLDRPMAEITGLPVCHIHHKIPRGLGGAKRDDRPDNLQCLCYKCHSGVEIAKLNF